MTYQEMLENARKNIGPYCKACPVCNGKACGNTVPGPGAKGRGDVAIRNYDAWQNVRINMDTISENKEPDTSFDFFGYKLAMPIIAGPVGALKLHYGESLTDAEYNDILVKGCKDAGIIAMTGDGQAEAVMTKNCEVLKAHGGYGIPTIKPWDPETLKVKCAMARDCGAEVLAMDIDGAGLPFLQGLTPPAGSKTVEELKEIFKMAGKPFILKGIMTVKGALKALEAGAAGIVVSNHGGRVLDQTPATAEVLPEIVKAVGGKMMILVDGGIRTGVDVFKALAMGADGVIIARPYVSAVYGGGEEGVKLITAKLGAELKDTMKMCGVGSLEEIGPDNIWTK